MNKIFYGISVAAMSLLPFGSATIAIADEMKSPYIFNVPPQSLATALLAYSEQAGVQLVVQPEITKGIVSRGVSGKLDREGALGNLLSGTDLDFYFTSDNTVVVHKKGEALNLNQQGLSQYQGEELLLASNDDQAINVSAREPEEKAANRLALEEVVVTARKTAENIQTTPVAVSNMTGDDLKNAKVDSVLDLQSLAPSLQVGTIYGTARVFIRGIGLTNFASGAEPSVAFHVDGAVVSRPAAQVGAFYDTARIEVLRGPQGSLYGRNATGGSINVITNRPTEEAAGYMNLTLGSYDLTELEGAVSGPLIDNKLSGRVAFKTVDRDGYGENIFFGTDIDDAKTRSIRASLSYDVSDNFSAFLSYNHHEEDDANYPHHMFGPGNPNVVPPEMAMGGTIAPDERDVNSEFDVRNKRKLDSVTLEMVWDLTDGISLKSLTNYLDYYKRTHSDLNGTPVQFLGITDNEDADQVSQELQLTWEGEGHSTLFGLYYFNEDIRGDLQIPGTAAFVAARGGRPFIQFVGDLESKSYAAFWNTTFHLSDEWNVTTGLRYSSDEKDHVGVQLSPVAEIPVLRDGDWSAWTPKLTVDYTPNDELFFYATIARGYKTGVINIGSAASDAVDPEYVWNYEIGMKSQWLDNRLQINPTIFYTTIDDLQVQRPIDGVLVTVNAAEAKTRGIELETIALLSENLTVKFNAAFVDGEFVKFPTANTTFSNDIIDVGGNSLPNSPEFQSDLTLEYQMQLNDSWSALLRVQGVYASERYFNEFEEDISHQDSTTKLNANLLLTSEDGQWSLNVWGRNLTDEYSAAHVNVSSSAIGHATFGGLTPPRTYGVTLGFNF